MLAVFATLTFLVIVWLCITTTASTLEHKGSTITAALKGRSPLSTSAIPTIEGRVSQRHPSPPRRPLRAQVELRAAA